MVSSLAKTTCVIAALTASHVANVRAGAPPASGGMDGGPAPGPAPAPVQMGGGVPAPGPAPGPAPAPMGGVPALGPAPGPAPAPMGGQGMMGGMMGGGGGCGGGMGGGCGGCGGGCGGGAPVCGHGGGGCGGQMGRFARAMGDPHLTALDGTGFDFMEAGTFKLLDCKGLHVHAFMDKCRLPVFPNGTCTFGIGIGYGDSVARFFVEKGKTVMARGSEKLSGLEITTAKGKTDGYRVFVSSDATSFVDVNLGSFAETEGAFLDLTVSLSDKFRNDATGVLSVGGNKTTAELVKEFKLADDKSLLTCESSDCTAFIKNSDSSSNDNKQTSAGSSTFRDGYEKTKISEIPLKKFDVRVAHEEATSKTSTNSTKDWKDSKSSKDISTKPLDKNRVTKLCNKIIKSIKNCDKFVKSRQFFIEQVCIKDTVASNVLDSIDHAKLAFLRQCRRQVDFAIHNKNDTNEATQTRTHLTLADPQKCPDGCSKRGKCLLNGCECAKGYSGVACEVSL